MVEQILLIIGLFFLLTGIGLYLHPALFKKILGDYMGSPALVYFHGALALILGAFIVMNHNIWGWNMQAVITVVGWAALIRGVWILIAQDSYLKAVKSFTGKGSHLKAEAIIAIIIGAILLYSYRAVIEGII